MGRARKPFIDKKNSTTYNLIYRAGEVEVDGEVAEQPQRQLVDARLGIGIGRPDEESVTAAQSRQPDGHPLLWLEDPPRDNISEARRQELIEMGFPDDGYDYLKHMRAGARSAGAAELTGAGPAGAGPSAAAEPSAGPSVFVAAQQRQPLEDDEKMFDARQLVIHQPAVDDVSAAQAAGGVTAFSRERQQPRRADVQELAELDAAAAALESGSEGDLEDDFLLTATQGEHLEDEPHATGPGLAAERGDTDSSSYAETDFSDSELDKLAAPAGLPTSGSADHDERRAREPGGPGSIASTYWRPERTDRKNLLTVVDERFEQLALGYDEDDIGSLADDDLDVAGDTAIDDFEYAMEDFLASEPGASAAFQQLRGPGTRGLQYRTAAEDAGARDPETSAAAAATLARAKEALRSAEDAERQGAPEATQMVAVADPLRERWDCESVLSLRSNLDNHPARIAEPGHSRKPRAGFEAGPDARRPARRPARITLSAKTGLPVADVKAGKAQQQTSEEAGLRDGAPGAPTALQPRKGETVEEKKARKAATKAANRSARVAKKELKLAFKGEMARQQRAMAAPAAAIIPLP